MDSYEAYMKNKKGVRIADIINAFIGIDNINNPKGEDSTIESLRVRIPQLNPIFTVTAKFTDCGRSTARRCSNRTWTQREFATGVCEAGHTHFPKCALYVNFLYPEN
jgi:hypothetical protein